MFWVTVVLVVVTLATTGISFFLYRSQTDPEVIVYTTHNPKRPTIIGLVIENIGKSVAYDIEFESDRRLPERAFGWEKLTPDNTKWMESGPLINGIPALPPGAKREIDWGQFVALKSVVGEKALTITARYKSKRLLHPEPVDYVTQSFVDVESYAGTVAYQDNEPQKIREELAKIERVLSKALNGSSTIRVEIVGQGSGELS